MTWSSTTADIEGTADELIVGAKYGYALLARDTGEFEYIKRVWDERDGPDKPARQVHTIALLSKKTLFSRRIRMRMNDGACDSQGRYWVGAMNDPNVQAPSNEGVLFRLDPDMTLHRMLEGVSIPNGMGWSADDRIFYFTDSPTRNIYKFDYDASTGNISNRNVFFHLEAENAVPDGFAMDTEGCFWVALCGGGKVLRLSPEGKIIGEVFIPTRMVSCPAFVNEELFITSAEEEDPNGHPESVRFGGSLFKVDVGVNGRPLHKFKRR